MNDDVSSMPTTPSAASTVLPPDIAGLYPFTRHFFKLPDGNRMHYIDEGHGPVVVMLHGNPTWSWMYRNLVVALSGRFRCIALDHIGCGFSDKPQDYAYTLAQHTRNVRLLLDNLGITNYTLVAHDWGGAIGMDLAGRNPDQVNRMVLMNTAAFTSMDMPMRIAICKIPYLGDFLVRGFNAFAEAAVRMAVERPLTKAVAKGFVWPYRNWHDRIATLRFVQDVPMSSKHRSFAELKRVEESLSALEGKPLLLCWGMRDWCFTPAFLKEWQRRFPKAEVEMVDNAGHYLLEDEGERVVVRIQEFLRTATDAR